MTRSYTSAIQSYEDANAYLGSKRERPLPHCSNLRIHKIYTMVAKGREGVPTPTDEIVVKLHGNTIVTLRPGEKTFACPSMYRNSMTTKRHRGAFGGPRKIDEHGNGIA